MSGRRWPCEHVLSTPGCPTCGHAPTLPPSSRQRGRNPAKAAHDRRISSADEADLRDDGGTRG